jgi:PAS domain S-box-containing protein
LKDREHNKEQLIKELEESLQTNEFLSLLLESMPVAVYTCEAGGDFGAIYISNNITVLTGYKPEDFTSNSEFWFYNVHPDDKEVVNVNLLTLLQTGHISYEYRWRVADGSYKWFYDISKLMKAQSGESNCIIGTFIDITERKKTEEALKTKEEKYRLLFSTEQDAIIIINAETRRIVDSNDAALRLYGYSKEEILKLTGLDLSAEPEESDAAISKVAMSTDKQIHYHTRYHKKKDGTVFPVEISSGIFMLKDRKFISAAIRDITHRKQALEELQKSAFYLDSVNDALIVLDAEREIIKVNKEFEHLWGYPAEEVLGKPVSILFPEEEVTKHFSEMKEAISSKNRRNFETIALTKTGGEVPISIRGSVIFDKDGAVEGFIGIFRDITERRCAEEELRKHREHLEELVEIRTLELRKINEDLKQEIAERKKIENALLESEKKLKIHAKELEEGNIALKVLLKQRENDKTELEENILSNIKHLVMPYITKLKRNRDLSKDFAYLNVLESNLNEIISPFSVKLSSKYLGLTPKEIQIADLIKDGKQDKDIMEILNISQSTVKTHRQNIRKKLGINSKRANLKTYLLSLTK